MIFLTAVACGVKLLSMLTLQKDTVRALDTGEGGPLYNMALDYAFFQCGTLSTIRFYSWNTRSISLGCSQSAETVLDQAACSQAGIAVVKRPTGGGIVFHGDDLTLSLFFTGHYAARRDVLRLYGLIGRCIAQALSLCGIDATVAADTLERPREQFCICQVSRGDVTVGGRKIAGGAIKWSRRGTLYQGYVALERSEWAVPCLSPVLQALYSPLDRWSTCVATEAGTAISTVELKQAILVELQHELNLQILQDEISEREQLLTEQILQKS